MKRDLGLWRLPREGQREGHLARADVEIAHEAKGDHVLASRRILDGPESLQDRGFRDRGTALRAHRLTMWGHDRGNARDRQGNANRQ